MTDLSIGTGRLPVVGGIVLVGLLIVGALAMNVMTGIGSCTGYSSKTFGYHYDATNQTLTVEPHRSIHSIDRLDIVVDPGPDAGFESRRLRWSDGRALGENDSVRTLAPPNSTLTIEWSGESMCYGYERWNRSTRIKEGRHVVVVIPDDESDSGR